VARAVLHRPELVFLDEPTSGLDPVATAGLREDLAALAAHEGVTVFLTTHNLNEAERLCGQVGVIRGGRLLAVGSPQQLRERQDTGHVEITARGLTSDVLALLHGRSDVETVVADDGRLSLALRPGASIAPIVALLVHHAVEIEEVRRARATLEDAFLDLMGAEPTANGLSGTGGSRASSGALG
jgi:ABC-2 type transport system ATP-binding protein